MRLVLALLSVVALAFAAPAAADRPTSEAIFDVFPDVNPCTGTPMTVTFVGTVFFHEHGSRVVAHAHRTITTSDGFSGHGTDNFVDNGKVVVSRLSDILSNASGSRFRAHFVFVLDLKTDTVRVDKGGLTCIRQ